MFVWQAASGGGRYTPKNPDRPSHHSHSTLLTDTRLAVDVLPGTETATLEILA